MIDTLRRLVWFGIVATAAFFAVFVVLGNFIVFSSQGEPAAIHDIISPGVHEMSGIVMVPMACDELSVETQRLSSTTYQLAFQTWRDPSVACPQVSTARPFETFVFAPSFGIAFLGTLDGKFIPISITSDLATSTSI